LLAWTVAEGTGPLHQHSFTTKYLAERTWAVEIAGGVVAHLGLRDDVVLLAAAELHQSNDDLETAIWSVEQAHPTAPAALSLVELYSDAGRHQDVVDLTNGTDNADDATALLLVLRGRAFAQLGYHEAAREALKEAMRVRTRSAPIRHRALLERAQVNLAQNRKAAARKDLEKILAEDPAYPNLMATLDTIG
jgi:tetratricopeptide (TPR) repeat protein